MGIWSRGADGVDFWKKLGLAKTLMVGKDRLRYCDKRLDGFHCGRVWKTEWSKNKWDVFLF